MIYHHVPTLPQRDGIAKATVLVYVIKGMLELLDSAEAVAHHALIAEVKHLSLLYFEDAVK